MTPGCSQTVIDLAAYRASEGLTTDDLMYSATTSDSRGALSPQVSRADNPAGRESDSPRFAPRPAGPFRFRRAKPALKNSRRERAYLANRREPFSITLGWACAHAATWIAFALVAWVFIRLITQLVSA